MNPTLGTGNRRLDAVKLLIDWNCTTNSHVRFAVVLFAVMEAFNLLCSAELNIG